MTAPFAAIGWQSSLVQPDWVPPHELTGLNFFTGNFIQDFSYAGYHLVQVPLPRSEGPVFGWAVALYGCPNPANLLKGQGYYRMGSNPM